MSRDASLVRFCAVNENDQWLNFPVSSVSVPDKVIDCGSTRTQLNEAKYIETYFEIESFAILSSDPRKTGLFE